jgi:subtilisin family serine protease
LREQGAIGNVLADLNYIMALRVDGTPWGIGGAPWGIGGAPWGIGGAGEGENGEPIASETFMRQWAFKDENGIGLIEELSNTTNRTTTLDGTGIRIGVFDTSPFTSSGTYTMTGWMAPPELRVFASEPEPLHILSSGSDVSDHGLFVAGLVHAVAPMSDIHLIRVLNDQAEGDLNTLIHGINSFVEQSLQENLERSGVANLTNTVFNFSLTLRYDPKEGEEALPPEAVAVIEQLAQEASASSGGSTTLQPALEIIRSLGGTVVAAAGNDSAEEPDSAPEASGLPAAYVGILSVEAADPAGERSCYSNSGAFRAPGGEGGPPLAGTPTPEAGGESAVCTPRHNTCDPLSADCEFGVISATYRVHQGFAYWVGTSFATPLVTGLAALELQAGVAPENIPGVIVFKDGIVNVPDSLSQ